MTDTDTELDVEEVAEQVVDDMIAEFKHTSAKQRYTIESTEEGDDQ